MNMKNMNHKYVRILTLCLLIAAVISITACTNSKKDSNADMNGTMNIDFGENGMIRNGTEYYTYQVKEGQKGIISIRKRTLYEAWIENIRYFVYTGFICDTDIKAFMLSAGTAGSRKAASI